MRWLQKQKKTRFHCCEITLFGNPTSNHTVFSVIHESRKEHHGGVLAYPLFSSDLSRFLVPEVSFSCESRFSLVTLSTFSCRTEVSFRSPLRPFVPAGGYRPATISFCRLHPFKIQISQEQRRGDRESNLRHKRAER